MMLENQAAALPVDLSRFGPRSVTSFYSNLVTRPTGRAVRMGVESQLAELGARQQPCLSILDFSQVRVIDYSCADEIVAKLLLRYAAQRRPAEVYFVVRGLEDHQQDAVEAVLEQHGLLLVAEQERGCSLLGPADPFQRVCWAALTLSELLTPTELGGHVQLPDPVVSATIESLVAKRVAIRLPSGRVCGVPRLLQD